MKKFNKVHLFIGFLALVIITIFCFSTKDKQSIDKYAQFTNNAKRTISWLKKHPGYSEKHEKQVDNLIKTYPDFGVYNISLAASFAGFDGEYYKKSFDKELSNVSKCLANTVISQYDKKQAIEEFRKDVQKIDYDFDSERALTMFWAYGLDMRYIWSNTTDIKKCMKAYWPNSSSDKLLIRDYIKSVCDIKTDREFKRLTSLGVNEIKEKNQNIANKWRCLFLTYDDIIQKRYGSLDVSDDSKELKIIVHNLKSIVELRNELINSDDTKNKQIKNCMSNCTHGQNNILNDIYCAEECYLVPNIIFNQNSH